MARTAPPGKEDSGTALARTALAPSRITLLWLGGSSERFPGNLWHLPWR